MRLYMSTHKSFQIEKQIIEFCIVHNVKHNGDTKVGGLQQIKNL